SELNRLFADIDQLANALESGVLRIETATGQHILKPEKRQLSDLNSDFWIQVTASFIGLLICTLVWLPGNLNLAKAGFILTGISYFLLATSAGIYSSRNLFIAADLFQP
ncbi:MAG: sensor histidine kinase, partial [Thalassolituus sp.]